MLHSDNVGEHRATILLRDIPRKLFRTFHASSWKRERERERERKRTRISRGNKNSTITIPTMGFPFDRGQRWKRGERADAFQGTRLTFLLWIHNFQRPRNGGEERREREKGELGEGEHNTRVVLFSSPLTHVSIYYKRHSWNTTNAGTLWIPKKIVLICPRLINVDRAISPFEIIFWK